MNYLKNFLKIATLLWVAVSCAPSDKESYMTDYAAFLDEIAENYKSYTEADWKRKEVKFEKLSEEWYEKFQNELTVKDELAVAGYKVKFAYYLSLSEVNSALEEVEESIDFEKWKRDAEYYIENDMQEDLDRLCREAEKAGKEAEKEFRKILKELGIEGNKAKKSK